VMTQVCAQDVYFTLVKIAYFDEAVI
jgi:hypothetical protein